MVTFRLDKEPWIPVVRRDGTGCQVSLAEVFRNAHQLAGLDGTPLEAAAISRFLLAIALLTKTPASLNEWSTLWKQRELFMLQCAQYVEAQGDAWDLFYEKHPFGQVPELAGTRNPAHLLLYAAARKNNAILADHNRVDVPASVEPAELARGIIATNAYAGSSGGGYLCGPLAMRSVALLTGRTLAETLLLNLPAQKTPPEPFDWSTYGHGATGPLDLVRRYLWASRRVRVLSPTEIMLAPGEKLPESEQDADPMVVLRKDSAGTAYIPLRLEVGRALWRSAHVLLCWQEDGRRLEAVDQLHRLVVRGHLPADQSVNIRVCSVAGDAQGPKTELWRDEMLPFGLSVISDDKRYAQLVRAVRAAEETAEATSGRIDSFAARYLQNGAESSPDKDHVARLADELRLNLSEFWSWVAPAGERIACDGFDEAQWARLLKEASEAAYRRAIDRLPADARRCRAEFALTNAPAKKKGTAV